MTPEERAGLCTDIVGLDGSRKDSAMIPCDLEKRIAYQIREAVAVERSRCAAIIDQEREEDGDPEQLRNLLAAIQTA